ncbi:hypothetical protein BJ508DRAFT_328460 [Ascobolus immersus RN42]|uniref:Uncharacterized protein n=1 Tax=Ascobolus immersus RN42 TaxID=1160509 RepID=A0A3N4I1R7_ASCIM|nr:hypothetical protein BJ508DRAFT_328460 [Ascobolus immersus RN42]
MSSTNKKRRATVEDESIEDELDQEVQWRAQSSGSDEDDELDPAQTRQTQKNKDKIKRKIRKLAKFETTGEKWSIPANTFWTIGHDMNKTRKMGGIPTAFGYNIRSITEHCHHFKAEEWKTWFTRYFPIYFRGPGRLDPLHYVRCMDFVRMLELCGKHYLSEEEIQEIEACLHRYLKYLEVHIYQRKYERLVLYKPTIHQLGHIPGCIRDLGPMYVFACWVIERVNGLIARGAKSRSDTNRNIALNILQREQFNHLKYTFSEESFKDHAEMPGNNAVADEPEQAEIYGFRSADERACAFASFKMYLDIMKDKRAEDGPIDEREHPDMRARKKAERQQSVLDSRDKSMLRNRGRQLQMTRALAAVQSGTVCKPIGNGKEQMISPSTREMLIKDIAGVWTNVGNYPGGWAKLRTTVYKGCTIISKGEFSASEMSISGSIVQKSGTTRNGSLVEVRDVDIPLPTRTDEDSDPDTEPPATIATVLYFFTINRCKLSKKEIKFRANNPLVIPEPQAPIDDKTIYALVHYYQVKYDKSFTIIGDKPEKGKYGVVAATDIKSLLGFVVDRGQKVVVDKFGPVYKDGCFDPTLYFDGDDGLDISESESEDEEDKRRRERDLNFAQDPNYDPAAGIPDDLFT